MKTAFIIFVMFLALLSLGSGLNRKDTKQIVIMNMLSVAYVTLGLIGLVVL